MPNLGGANEHVMVEVDEAESLENLLVRKVVR
jgi:hypothetical protein